MRLLTAFLSVFLAAPSLHAIEVTTTADENGSNSSACALREAVRAINDQASFGGCTFTSGDFRINLGAGTYNLSLNIGVSDRVQLRRPMTISGAGPRLTTIQRSGVFDDDMLFININLPGSAVLEGLTLRGSTGRFNSAIDFLAETGLELVIRDVDFRDNVNEIGAAFRIQGDGDSPIRLERVVFENNTSFGSFNSGAGVDCSASESQFIPSLHLVDVVFRNNVVDSSGSALGGGMLSEGCDVEMENVTFVGNEAISSNGTSVGGGLAVFADKNANTVTLTNVTFVDNTAAIGGGFFQDDSAASPITVSMTNVTFADNTAVVDGDHVFQASGETRLRNVLFGPSAGDDCGGDTAPVFTLLGGNMDSDGSCGVELTEANPGLASALANRGGFTPVLALLPGAAAIDAGTNTGCPSTDQRGETRPFDGDNDQTATCDIGAFEIMDEIFIDSFERLAP
ncbi:MAG: CSLREA domain-containing protein [Wenzhouxiangellaceae bacterium]